MTPKPAGTWTRRCERHGTFDHPHDINATDELKGKPYDPHIRYGHAVTRSVTPSH
jgi:hypothetical protein